MLFIYNLVIYTLLACAKQATHTHTHTRARARARMHARTHAHTQKPWRPTGECIVTGMLKNKITNGMRV